MSQYWEIQTYEQPTEAKLKKNASESMKKDIKRGKENQPVVISGKKIAKTWWGRHGVKIWSAMQITKAVWTGGNVMSEPGR